MFYPSNYPIQLLTSEIRMGPSWPWQYGSWIYNYLCNKCLSPLMLWVWISIRARCTTLCDHSLPCRRFWMGSSSLSV